jgi:hypothetical protein
MSLPAVCISSTSHLLTLTSPHPLTSPHISSPPHPLTSPHISFTSSPPHISSHLLPLTSPHPSQVPPDVLERIEQRIDAIAAVTFEQVRGAVGARE